MSNNEFKNIIKSWPENHILKPITKLLVMIGSVMMFFVNNLIILLPLMQNAIKNAVARNGLSGLS